MKKLFTAVLLFSATLIAQDLTFTLEESLEAGLKNSKDLKISGSKIISSDAGVTEASSRMLPRLSLSASFLRVSEIPPFEIVTPFSPDPIRLYDIIQNNYNIKLSLQQPLFTGFRLSSLKNAAEYNYKISEAEYDEEINNAAFNIYNTFWNYYKAEEMLKLINENLEQAALHLENTNNFLEYGLVTLNDQLMLEVQYSNIKLMKIEAENNLELARASFNKVIGLDLQAPSKLIAEEISISTAKYDFPEILNEAKENRNDLKSLEYKIKIGEERVNAAESGWLPSVYLFGNFYYSRPNQRILPPEDKFNETWDVGIGLNWELWNWGETSAQTTQAEELKYQAEILLSKLTDAVEIEIYRLYLSYLKSLERITVIKRSVKQAEENYRITGDKYNSQLAASSDLIDAEVALLQAKTNLTNALVDYELTRLSLDKSIGRKIY
jgi:outer membrane protein